jgi:uncharacterized protein (TIGR02594 family)
MPTAWAETAFRELLAEIHEIQGKDHNPRILEYLTAVNMVGIPVADETAWCSAFVNWCLRHSFVLGTGKANARSFMTWGRAVGNPNLGAIVVLWRGDPRGWQGHVGFYVGEQADLVYILGGNQGNAVSIQGYQKQRVLGYRMPLESNLMAA